MINGNLFLFEGLSADELQRCYQMGEGKEVLYRKGEIIYDTERAHRALAYVMDGHVRVTHGRVVMNDLFAGDVFGVAALYGSNEAYPSIVSAISDSHVFLIPQEMVSQWMAEVPRVAENYIRFLSDRIRFLNRRISTLTAGPTDDRLWKYLLAHRDNNQTVHISGGMSALADTLDMGRSSLYRSLDALALAGRIRREKQTIYLLDLEE